MDRLSYVTVPLKAPEYYAAKLRELKGMALGCEKDCPVCQANRTRMVAELVDLSRPR